MKQKTFERIVAIMLVIFSVVIFTGMTAGDAKMTETIELETEVETTEAETYAQETTAYAQVTVVVELDQERDEVVCIDFNGNEWVFTGIEDWAVGDYATMVMNDMGTPIIYDDEIVSVRYDGWLDGNFGYDYESGQEVVSMTH